MITLIYASGDTYSTIGFTSILEATAWLTNEDNVRRPDVNGRGDLPVKVEVDFS